MESIRSVVLAHNLNRVTVLDDYSSKSFYGLRERFRVIRPVVRRSRPAPIRIRTESSVPMDGSRRESHERTDNRYSCSLKRVERVGISAVLFPRERSEVERFGKFIPAFSDYPE